MTNAILKSSPIISIIADPALFANHHQEEVFIKSCHKTVIQYMIDNPNLTKSKMVIIRLKNKITPSYSFHTVTVQITFPKEDEYNTLEIPGFDAVKYLD